MQWTPYMIYAFGLFSVTKNPESQIVFGRRNQFTAARFMTISFIGSSLNAMELVVRN